MSESVSSLASRVAAHEEAYWRTVFQLVSRIGSGFLPYWLEGTRKVVVFECADGVLALRYPKRTSSFIERRHSQKKVADELAEWSKKVRDPFGTPSPESFSMRADLTGGGLHFSAPFLGALATFYTTDFLSGFILVPGTNPVVLSDPVAQAHEDVGVLLLAYRFGRAPEPRRSQPGTEAARELVLGRLDLLAADYLGALARCEREEDMQRYFTLNPFVLTHAGQVTPKAKLGKEWVTDFVVENPLGTDHTHVLVEIEAPGCQLFRKDGTQPTAELTHAITQTDDWRTWLKEHRHYFREDFPTFQEARYLIVAGREGELADTSKVRALRELNAKHRDTEIVTYDRLHARLLELRGRLSELRAAENATPASAAGEPPAAPTG